MQTPPRSSMFTCVTRPSSSLHRPISVMPNASAIQSALPPTSSYDASGSLAGPPSAHSLRSPALMINCSVNGCQCRYHARSARDPTRRRVVELLRDRPRRAGELARRASTSAPAMSRHLRVLRAGGLVEVESLETDARIRVYRLRQQPFEALQRWLPAFWTTSSAPSRRTRSARAAEASSERSTSP